MLDWKVIVINPNTNDIHAEGYIRVIDPVKDVCSATVTIKVNNYDKDFRNNTLFNIRISIQEYFQGYKCEFSRVD